MKSLHFLVLILLLVITSCSKFEIPEKEKEKAKLLIEISQIAEQTIEDDNYEELKVYNDENPFDFVGEVLANVTSEAIMSVENGKTNPDSIIGEFKKKLKQNLSSSYYLDTTNIDITEIEIFKILLKTYVNERYNSFIVKSKLIENSLMNSCYFNDIQKQRILTYSSTLRHIASEIKNYSNNTKSQTDETIEECFRKKLAAFRDCKECFFEKVICIFSFPECLGIKLLDCVIYVLIQEIF